MPLGPDDLRPGAQVRYRLPHTKRAVEGSVETVLRTPRSVREYEIDPPAVLIRLRLGDRGVVPGTAKVVARLDEVVPLDTP